MAILVKMAGCFHLLYVLVKFINHVRVMVQEIDLKQDQDIFKKLNMDSK